MEYPGICTAGLPAAKLPWTGVKVKGTKESSHQGQLAVTFLTAGPTFLTSRIKGECDAKWLRINVNPPAGR